MSRLLYIGHIIEKPKTGGEIGCANIQIVLKQLFNDSFYHYDLRNTRNSFISRLFLLYPGLHFTDFKKIKTTINEVVPAYIFIESAQYGVLVKFIKKRFPSIKVFTYFNNIEISYAKSYLSFKNIKSWYFFLLTKFNESYGVYRSDYCFAITSNDAELMQKLYNRSPDYIFPFSTKNTISENDIINFENNKKNINKHECLFVGSNFFGNTDGLNWFIQNILPQTDIHLTIVGSGMSNVYKNSDKISVFDYVEDLSVFYKETDFVLLPIISGGGMKTKTADAMMYGKAIVGTPEVFYGYDIIDLPGIYICRTQEEFIKAIKKIYTDNIFDFNHMIHERFVEKHSIDSTCQRMKKFFMDIEKE